MAGRHQEPPRGSAKNMWTKSTKAVTHHVPDLPLWKTERGNSEHRASGQRQKGPRITGKLTQRTRKAWGLPSHPMGGPGEAAAGIGSVSEEYRRLNKGPGLRSRRITAPIKEWIKGRMFELGTRVFLGNQSRVTRSLGVTVKM